MMWVRIDNRLIHGQVIETWLPYTRAGHLFVANDELAADPVRQEIMGLAIPAGITVHYSAIRELPKWITSDVRDETFVLFATCPDAKLAFECGLNFSVLNVGNLHYGPGKKQVCAHIALGPEDISCLNSFVNRGVTLDFRCVPHKSVQVNKWH